MLAASAAAAGGAALGPRVAAGGDSQVRVRGRGAGTTSRSPGRAQGSRRGCGRGGLAGSVRRARVTCGTWLEHTTEVTVGIPVERAFEMWKDPEGMPQWMPWLRSVRVVPGTPLSEWCIGYDAFGQSWTFSWTSRLLPPLPNKKIAWVSVDGLPNRGAVRFERVPAGPTPATRIAMTVSYELPDALARFGKPALDSLVPSILQGDMDRFKAFAEPPDP